MGLISGIQKKYKSASRYNQILKVLVKYGFEDLVQHMEERKRFGALRKLIPRQSRIHASKFSKWAKMRLVCEELGPTFVKFGQILSNRPDLIPFELVHELEKLQDNVPPMPEGDARMVVEKELAGRIEELFAWFDPKPFASASMAQVHKVTLLNGDRAALKIQRPGITKVIAEDIKVMYSVAEILEKRIPAVASFDPVGLVRNFEESITKELDFINESINVQRFYNHVIQDQSRDQFATAPKVFQQFTTERVLALEFVKGIKIDRINKLKEKGHDTSVLARRLLKSYFKQIFEYGFFHADPHPGNLLVMPNSHICFLDFGMMGSMMPKDVEIFGQLFISISRRDVRKIIRSIQQLSTEKPVINMRDLEYDISEFVEKYYVRDIHQNEMSTVMLELKDIIVEHGLKVPTHFFLFARSLVTIEGVVEKLDPELEQFEMAKPFLAESIKRRYDPVAMGRSMLNSLVEINKYMEEFPQDLRNAIRKIESGKIKVDLSHKGIDPIVHTVQRVTKQLVSAFITAALIIGSTIVIINGVEPLWKGISAIGIVGLVIAAVLGAGMLWNISKGDYDY